MNEEKIGKFISTLRKKKNLTQSELAKMLHVTDKAISKWETGKGFPDITLLIPLSNILEITVNELLCGEKIHNLEQKTEERIKATIKLSENCIKEKEKKLSKIFTVISLIILIILYISESLTSLGFLGIIIIVIILLVIKYIKKQKLKNLIPLIILLLFTFYSYFTSTGSVRLELFLMRHPLKAYTTKLQENVSMSHDNKRYFTPKDNINVISGRMGYIECRTYFGLKISSYYGF